MPRKEKDNTEEIFQERTSEALLFDSKKLR